MDSSDCKAQTTQMNTYISYVAMLGNPSTKDDLKLKAVQELSENLEIILISSQYPVFLAKLIKTVQPILLQGKAQFISEYNIYQTRKVILEIIYRLPTNEYLKPYLEDILTMTLNLLEVENEENGLICLHIFSEYQKKYKPNFNPQVLQFLQFVKNMYNEFLTNYLKIVQAKSSLAKNTLVDVDTESLLTDTHIVTTIYTKMKDSEGNFITYNLLPKAKFSLKVLQEVPSNVVLMHALYKQNISEQILEITSLIIKFITLKTNEATRNRNEEIFFEFIGAQVKGLMLISYNIKDFLEPILRNISVLVKGIIDLLQSCPAEATHFRKEIFMSFRHFIVTKFQRLFIPYVNLLLDEEYLLGSGYTAHEVLRPLVLNVIGDFIHHVRHLLFFPHLVKAVHMFSKILHDESLPPNVQNVSCKVLHNLIEFIKKSPEAENNTQRRKVLQRILEVFILKLEVIVKQVMPIFSNTETQINVDNQQKNNLRIGSTVSPNSNQNIGEYKNIVKWLILGIKEIVTLNFNDSPARQFDADETLLFSQFLKWGMECLNLYTIDRLGLDAMSKNSRIIQIQELKLKEEKQLFENFAKVFTLMHPLTFRKIFSSELDYVVNQVLKNKEFQAIVNYFLLNTGISSIFGTIMTEYLLERMDQVGANLKKSAVYLTLFKTIFGSVAFSPEENEQMLRSNLHQIVRRSLELPATAKDPLNYFLLLRALFRSISGGSHELLYQEFLPLLPKLFEDLNRFQSKPQTQEMKEILLELCLTIPIRLSYILPYIPKLMNPIACALNGSPYLIGQGLRILDLCLNNLDPSYIHGQLRLISADLMQSLYRILRESTDDLALTAFRVIGKLGGEGRKMITEPQKLQFVDSTFNSPGIVVYFEDYSKPIAFSVKKVIDTAFSTLDCGSDIFYKKQSWDVINSYLSATIRIDDDSEILSNFFNHSSFKESEIVPQESPCYVNEDWAARDVQKTALSGLFIAAADDEINQSVFETMTSYVRHYTMISIAQQVGQIFSGHNPLVMIDALKVIFSHERKELFKIGFHVLDIIFKTATSVVGSLQRVSELPLMDYLFEKMISLCYEGAWYSKLGGCMVINFFIERMPIKWILIHLVLIFRGLVFVIMDLIEEIGNGTTDVAKENLNKLLRVCADPGIRNKDSKLDDIQKIAIHETTRELILHITSPRTIVRKEAMSLLYLLAEIQKVPLTEIIDLHKEILTDLIPPIKHRLTHQSVDVQIGIIDGNAFCTSLNPPLLSFDLSLEEHNIFYRDLFFIINTEDKQLAREPCYKNLSDFIPLKTSALRAFSSYYSVTAYQKVVFDTLNNAFKNANIPIQETACECLKKLASTFQINMEIVNRTLEPLYENLENQENLNLLSLKYLLHMTEIFPLNFNHKLCVNLVRYLSTSLQNLEKQSIVTTSSEIVQQILTIVEILYKTPADSSNLIPTLCKLFLQSEKDLNQVSSPFRFPLARFLTRYPLDTLAFFLTHNNIKDEQYGLFLEYILTVEEGTALKEKLKSIPMRLTQMFLAPAQPDLNLSKDEKIEIRFRAIRIISILIESDDEWLSAQSELITAMQKMWYKNEYVNYHTDIENVKSSHLIESKLLVKAFLSYLRGKPKDIKFLFHMLKIVRLNLVSEFKYFKEFLENTVAQTYGVEWKREMFMKFVGCFSTKGASQQLKADILKYIVYNCFEASFKKGEKLELIGGPPSPYKDSSKNLISVFINKIIVVDEPCTFDDCLKISILRFSCLLIENAAEYIHDATKKSEGLKLRRLMAFAWPCLLTKHCVDPISKYHGHLLLSHIIGKFSIAKSIVIQVFHSLLKAHAAEPKLVIKEALDILIPIFPHRMDKGHNKLAHLTRKMLCEESHLMPSLCHILHFVTKHYKIYYPVRHYLIHILVSSMEKLSNTPNIEYKKLASDIVEIIVEWELEAMKEEMDNIDVVGTEPMKRSLDEKPLGSKRIALQKKKKNFPFPLTVTTLEPLPMTRVESIHVDKILNFIFKLACQVYDASNLQGRIGEQLTKRCGNLLRKIFVSDIWSETGNLDLSWLDKILMSVQILQTNYENVYKALELLLFLVRMLKKKFVLYIFRKLETGLSLCALSNDIKIVKLMYEILMKLMSMFPAEPILSIISCKEEAFNNFYKSIQQVIFDGLTYYENTNDATVEVLSSSLMMVKAACTSNVFYIDSIITTFMNVFQKLVSCHLNSKKDEVDQISVDLLIISLDVLSNRVGILSVPIRKLFMTFLLVKLIQFTPDVKVMKAIVKILENWIKNNDSKVLGQNPTIKENSLLFVKMMENIDNRFPEDRGLKINFLEVVFLVYKDKRFKLTELTLKLEIAFLSGLRSTQPDIRIKFFEIFNASIERRLMDRLEYIICNQNWQLIGSHYWIKQCIELLLFTSNRTTRIEVTKQDILLTNIRDLMKLMKNGSNVTNYMNSELNEIMTKQVQFLENIKKIRTEEFLTPAIYLCHLETSLAKEVWIDLFPKLWNILRNEEQSTLMQDIVPFICSGAHIVQKYCNPSAIATFCEALNNCKPPILMRPAIMKYLGKAHNLWHQMTFNLEKMIIDSENVHQKFDCYDFEPDFSPNKEILDSLSDMYSLLCEDDMWSGLWQKHAFYKETLDATALEQQGFLEKAQEVYSRVMHKFNEDFLTSPASEKIQKEVSRWEERWVRCAKELNQWNVLLDYGKSRTCKNPFIILESCYKTANWVLLQECLDQVEEHIPTEMVWKINLYRGYLSIYGAQRQNLKIIDDYAIKACNLCILDWRKLPYIISHIHFPILQAAHEIIDLQDGKLIHQNLTATNSFYVFKNVINTWKNRLPTIADDFNHWSNIFTWRECQYKSIISFVNSQPEEMQNLLKNYVHIWAQSVNTFSKIARKQNLSSVCLDSLTRIHEVESVTVKDCYERIEQQVKCYLQLASHGDRNRLQDALNCMESTDIQYFKKEIISDFLALKGKLLSLLGESDEAYKTFSASIQLNENNQKAWGLWGEYMEQVFKNDTTNMEFASSAVLCFLNACRTYHESKSRKYIPKILWLLNYDDENNTLLKQVDNYVFVIFPIHWISWIPQLLMWLIRAPGVEIVNLLSVISRLCPQAIYFEIRTLYMNLKLENLKIFKMRIAEANVHNDVEENKNAVIKASEPMVRCSIIMKKLREFHPTIISTLEGIVDQITKLRESWPQEILKHLRQLLIKSYRVAFENKESISEAQVTTQIFNFIEKFVTIFKRGIKNISTHKVDANFSIVSEDQMIQNGQNLVLQKMYKEFAQDFIFTDEKSKLLLNLIKKLKKWIKILENQTRSSSRSFLLEKKCRFLSNFNLETADVGLPGANLLPKFFVYPVKIVKFLPWVDVIQHKCSTAHRFWILGNNGQLYPYLVEINNSFVDARRDFRVLQLLNLLNTNLRKQKETFRRFLQFTIPKMVPLNPHMRLIEDNPKSITLMNIYKQSCDKISILHDAPISKYYELLANLQARGTGLDRHKLKSIFNEVQTNLIPKTILKDWAMTTFQSSPDYWTFRKVFISQLSLAFFSEYVFHLTKLSPDMMNLHRDSGIMNVAYFTFDFDEVSGRFNVDRPVPFRLTPNISEFVTNIGITGPLTANLIATARCLMQPSYQIDAILRPILRDEIIDDTINQPENVAKVSETLIEKNKETIKKVTDAIASIMTRLESVAYFHGNDSKVRNLLNDAKNVDNLCQMDPSWHPWL